MTANVMGALGHGAMITVFVTVMMIAIEYANVLSRGTFEGVLRGSPATQYVAAVLLGALPGCLGAFTVVALYSHRVVTLGALVATMIATSGDEAFVMLAMFPGTAAWLMLGLALIGLATAPIVDRLAGSARYAPESCGRLTVHPAECECLPRGLLVGQWRRPSGARVLLTLGLGGYVLWVGVGGGALPSSWTWVRVTLLLTGLFGTFVVVTVPDHFLRDHLWAHVVVRHVPQIFAWTTAVLVAVAVLGAVSNLETLVRDNPWKMLAGAGLLGLIPQSGPHLVFVTLYAGSGLPVSILAASSIVQDGHGMLPLLAQSPRDFVRVKLINLGIGLAVGAALLSLGL